MFVALGSLSAWHGRLIAAGETSIEGNINKTETIKFKETGKIYINPYDYGWKKNWKIFLGLDHGR